MAVVDLSQSKTRWPVGPLASQVLQPDQDSSLEGCVAIGRDVDLYNFAQITVRRMTVISQHCCLCAGPHDFMQGMLQHACRPGRCPNRYEHLAAALTRRV